MAKILFFNVPAHGHVNPTLPVVAELVRRGHSVFYYNTVEFQPQLERTGAVFRPYGVPMMTGAEMTAAVNQSLLEVTLLLFNSSKWLLPYLTAEIEREQPDLVIYDSLAMSAGLAARRLDVRAITSISTFLMDGTHGLISLGDTLRLAGELLPRIPQLIRGRRALVQAYGQPLPDSLVPVFSDLNLVFTSQQVQPTSSFIDERFAFVGPSIDPTTRAVNDFPFEQITRQPLIYISLGTIHHDNHAFYRRCFEAFRAWPGQVIVSAGSATDLTALGAIPDNFIVRSSVPQLEILRRADLFITHGGMNSVQEALYFGVPMVVIPQQMEQSFNGRVVARSGAGLLIKQQMSASAMRAAAEQVLGDSSYRETAHTLGDSLRAAGGYVRAADLVEGFVEKSGVRI